jgi:hypothetical protein
MYESRHVEIHGRYAFMKSFERSSINNSRLSSIGMYGHNNKMSSSSFDDVQDYYYYSSTPNKHETKEISYFDWSKVKLYANRYKDHESFEPNKLLNKKTDQQKSTSSVNELPQILTLRF